MSKTGLQYEFFDDGSKFVMLGCLLDEGILEVTFKHLENGNPQLFECEFQSYDNCKRYNITQDEKKRCFKQYVVSWKSTPCYLPCEELANQIAGSDNEKSTWIYELTDIMINNLPKEIDFAKKQIKSTEEFDKFFSAYKKRYMSENN